jgi:Tol biopolymer transport system component
MLTAALSWFLRSPHSDASMAENLECLLHHDVFGDETTPAVSRDGAQVAFSWKEQGGRRSIYVSRSDGQEAPRQLTTVPQKKPRTCLLRGRPIRLRLHSYGSREPLNGEIIVIPAQGGPERKLRDIRIAGSSAFSTALAWTPDGTQIAFASQSLESGRSTLSLMRLADGRVRTLVSPPDGVIGDASPAISPDGRSLAFVRWSSPTTSTLLVQKLGSDGEAVGEPRCVAGKAPASPVWADNKRLLFKRENKSWNGKPVRQPNKSTCRAHDW